MGRSGKGQPGREDTTPGLFEAPFSRAAASAPATDAKPPDHLGHRQRLRDRFTNGGPDALPDYELLELVLFRAIPRRDTKGLAKRLIAHFGSFAEVINAPVERLKEVDGIGDAVATELKIVRAAAIRLTQAGTIGRQAVRSWSDVIAYCRAAMAFEEREQFRILFLDKRNQIVADEVQGRGTIDHAPVYVREVVRRALQLGAASMVLVHNHPSGDPTPSRNDIDMTRLIIEAARPLGIAVHDHVIVARGGHASLRELKLI